jgi:hypothetical protein
VKTSEDLNDFKRSMVDMRRSKYAMNVVKSGSDIIDPWLFVTNKMNLSNNTTIAP